MKRLFYVLFAFLIVCAVPVAALPSLIAKDDGFVSDDGGCVNGWGWRSEPIGNVMDNDIFPSLHPVTAIMTQSPQHGWVPVFSDGWLWYSSNSEFGIGNFFSNDYLLYRLYDAQTNTYSNTAKVNIHVIQFPFFGNVPFRTRFYTPKNTLLSVMSNNYLGDVGEALCGIPGGCGWINYMSDFSHGTLILPEMCELGPCQLKYDGTFDYMPDDGFTGWDKITYNIGYDSGDYGDCFSKESEVWIYVGNEPYPSPEFPSAILPIILIIGFLGTVLYIRSVRKH